MSLWFREEPVHLGEFAVARDRAHGTSQNPPENELDRRAWPLQRHFRERARQPCDQRSQHVRERRVWVADWLDGNHRALGSRFEPRLLCFCAQRGKQVRLPVTWLTGDDLQPERACPAHVLYEGAELLANAGVDFGHVAERLLEPVAQHGVEKRVRLPERELFQLRRRHSPTLHL